MNTAIKRGVQLAAVFDKLPGVKVSHHYQSGDKYYFHLKVVESGLFGLLDFCESANIAAVVYRHGNELRYTAMVTPDSQELVIEFGKVI